MPHDDILSLLKTVRPEDTIRITRYPDRTEMIEMFPPWRPEKAKKAPVPRFQFDDQGKEYEVPDWLKEKEAKKSRKK